MTIAFSQIPTSTLVPGIYVEINASKSKTNVDQNQRILVIGQRVSTGSVPALTPTMITSYNQAVDAFGANSNLAGMFKVLFTNNNTTEKWAIALDDIGAGTAAVGSITITATSAQNGTLSLYLGGVLVPVAVSTSDTAAAIATAAVAAINANSELPITAVVDGTVASKVNLTYDHKGTLGNAFDVRVNYSGGSAGEVLPSGVTVAIVQPTGGASDPTLASAYAAMPDEVFNYILVPYSDSTNLNASDDEMDSRWSATRMLPGHVFTSVKGTTGTVGTAGSARNGQHVSLFDAANNSPTPPSIWSSALIGQVAAQASSDPALPFKDLLLKGVLAPPQANRRSQSERESLLHSGIATHYIGQDGKAYIERLTTTYQLSNVGLADGTYLDANTVFTLSRLMLELAAHLASRFPRFKLADDGTNTSAGSSVVTPAGIKAEVVAKGQEWAAKGWIENIATFITTVVVERDVSDPTRVNVLIEPDLVNQLQVVGVSITFSL